MGKITPRLLIPIFLSVLILISINFILLYSSIATVLARQDRLTHSLEITTSLEAVFADINQAEMSENSYILTGDISSLRPYNEVIPDITNQFAALKLLTAADSKQQNLLAELQPLVQGRLSMLDKAITLQKTGGTVSYQQIPTNDGKNTLSQIRSLIDTMEDQERTLFQKQDTAYQQSIGTLYRSFTIAVIVTALALAAIYMLFNRDLENRILLEQRKDDFLSMASHELKTPLTTMKIYAQLLQKQLQTYKIQDRYTIKMEDQINRLIKLVANLLDTSKIQAGKLDLHKESVNVNQMVTDIVDALQLVTPTHQIKIVGKLKHRCVIDKDRIEQVITNLLTNAIKYSPNAKKILVKVWEDKTQAYIGVKDFGVGMAESDRKKIFSKFFRAKEQSAALPGFGMGLYISYQIMKLHGGAIEVTSKKGKGSCFTMVFPRETLS